MNSTTNTSKILEDAWLNLDVEDSSLVNPFSMDVEEEFHIKLTWLLSNPEYFSFICKYIFNIEILPAQALMLREVWGRKFPTINEKRFKRH